MASLRVLKGGTPNQLLPLDKPTIVLGREQKICDFLATYHADAAIKTPLPEHMRPTGPEDDAGDGPSTVQATLGRIPQQQLLETQPADRIRALLDVANALAQTLTIDDLLQKVA